MKASKKTGVAMVFIAATLTATNVAAQSDDDTAPTGPSESTFIDDFEAQADFLGGKFYVVGPADFETDDNTDAYAINGSAGRCLFPGNNQYAEVELPHGSEIIGATLYGSDSLSTDAINFSVRSRSFSTNASTDLFNGSTGTVYSDGQGSFSGEDQGADNTLDKSTEDFYVRIQSTEPASSSLQLCAIVLFYFPPVSGGLEFHPIDPCAIFDTRSGSGAFNGKLTSDEVITVDAILSDYSTQGGFAGSCGIASAGGFLADNELLTDAVAINLVALNAEGTGNLKAWANNVAEPPGGVVVYEPGVNNSNEFALSVEGGVGCGLLCVTNGGLFKVKNNSSSPVHVRGVVVGYFTPVDSKQ